MHSPSQDRNPKHCSWCDKEDYYWECPRCRKNYGEAQPGHLLAPDKRKFARPWKLPDNHGQKPPAPAEPAAPPPAAAAASEAPAAQQISRLRAPRP
eukprot:1415356-Pyramimonas_sp.AAC.1